LPYIYFYSKNLSKIIAQKPNRKEKKQHNQLFRLLIPKQERSKIKRKKFKQIFMRQKPKNELISFKKTSL